MSIRSSNSTEINSSYVSIVIPAFNHGKYLSEAINSVLEQDYPKVELIVLNDGSTDSTENILQKYRNKFYWETQKNIGQANTLNKGWGIAKGGILSYLSADDTLEKNAVSTSLKALNANDSIVMTYCDFKLVDENSNIIKISKRQKYNFHEMVVNLNCIPGPGVFFKRSSYEKAGPWNPKYRQMPDYEFWLRLGITGDFLHIPEVLANFRIHNESQTFSIPSVNKAEEPVNVLNDFFSVNEIPAEIIKYKNKALSNAYLFSSQLHLKASRYNYAFCYMYKSIRLYPINFAKLKTYKMLIHGLSVRPFYLLNRIIRKALKISN